MIDFSLTNETKYCAVYFSSAARQTAVSMLVRRFHTPVGRHPATCAGTNSGVLVKCVSPTIILSVRECQRDFRFWGIFLLF